MHLIQTTKKQTQVSVNLQSKTNPSNDPFYIKIFDIFKRFEQKY